MSINGERRCRIKGSFMLAKHFDEGEIFHCAGNKFAMLLPRDITRACEVVLQTVRPGASTPPNTHDTFMQVYLIWSGEAEMHVGSESTRLTAPAVAYVPQHTEHWIDNLSPDQELQYLYLSVWPDGIPHNEIEGGWKKVYSGIIDEYVNRGYPVDGKK